jgi:hypothetical protein
MSRRALQATLVVLGTIALAFGTLTVITGAGGVLTDGTASANVDSELRFYAAWYVAAGILLLRAARRVDTDGFTIRVICAGFLVAACGRALSLITVGEPHLFYLALMVVEFAIPAVVVPWQAAVSRRAAGR